MNKIRLDDVSTYTEQLCSNVDAAFPDADKATKAALDEARRDLRSASAELLRESTALGATRSRLTRSADGTATPLADARSALRGLLHHLNSQIELGLWSGSVAAFFGGNVAFGRAHARVVAALRAALTALAADKAIADRVGWTKRLNGAYDALNAMVQGTSRAFDQLRQGTSALARTRREWRQRYDRLVKIASSHLILAGRDDEAATIDPFARAKIQTAAAKRGRARAQDRRAAKKLNPPTPAPVDGSRIDESTRKG